jgi:amino acid adenylation domain-containing protein
MSNDLQERLARLSPEKRELLLKKLQEQNSGAAPVDRAHPGAIPRAARTGELPLAYAQQRLWFLDQLAPGSTAYSMAIMYRLTGTLNVAALEQSLAEIVQRHETLRTTFGWHADQPAQIIHARLPLEFKVIHVDAAAADRETAIQRLIADETNRPFDLERGPLFRSLLLCLNPNEHSLLLNMHHIISDEWSIGVLSRELASLYRALSAGQSAALPDLSIQYADYAVWQRTWLTSGPLAEQLAYWKKQLADLPPALELPTDHPAPIVQSLRGAHHWFEFSPELSEAVKTLSQHESTTLFMTLLAAFQAVLYRYTGQPDLVIGSPIANRTRTEIEPLIGFFVNTLVLRTDLSGNPTFRELLRRVRETTLAAYTHQDLPFEILVEELQPDRTVSHNPLFQIMFAVQSEAILPPDLSGLKIEAVEIENDTSKFDLTLTLSNQGSHLSGRIEYCTDLFEPATIERLVGHLETLLAAVVVQPDRRLSDLPLLTPAEQHLLLVEWNATQSPYPAERCLHQLFEEQVTRTPEAVALTFEDHELTYSELNRRANQLAHYLQALGVGPETLVGICLERSVEMIIGLLGILKAGGAYLPLDPTYPPDRLGFMLEDSQASVVLTYSRLRERLPAQQLHPVCFDIDGPVIARQSTHNLDPFVSPQHLAYVSYTSGSTGLPKGVRVMQRSVVRLVRATNYARFGPEDIFLQLAPLAFDASTLEVWGSLLNGGCLIVFPPGLAALSEIGMVLEQERVTTLWLTAGLFHQMVEQQLPALRSVRQLLAGGDVLSAVHVRQALTTLKEGWLINGYGPTENTTFTCCYPMREVSQVDDSVSIGRPIANTQVYVLDEQLQPTPIGVTGELYIGGAGLARDYLNRPDLTAEKFVPNPFASSSMPGTRLYKTGDLVRYRADGNIEFLGRRDFQVKVRGFRIELGEIETVLRQHPTVTDAVLVVHTDQAGDKRLIAYLAVKQLLTTPELRRHVQAQLPEYMTPAGFVLLDALPLTPNGKIDRRALPAWQPDLQVAAEARIAPPTPIQELVADQWAQVLGVERIGLHDNFFELGGHSLLATQIVARLRQQLGYDLTVRAIFEKPTVASLVEWLEAQQQTPTAQSPHIERVGREQPWPLSFSQQQLWLIEQITPGSIAYNIPLVLRLRGALNIEMLHASLNEIVRRHEVLRTTFVLAGEQPVQRIVPALTLPLPVIDLRELPETEREDRATQAMRDNAQRPFDLAQGPLLRIALFQLGENEYCLSLTAHHIVFDEWSLTIFQRELSVLYRAFAAGQPSPLPELAIQYADFAAWQRTQLQGPIYEEQLAYWKRQLHNLPPALELPTDHPAPAFSNQSGAHYEFSLPQALSQALKTLSRHEGVTLFMMLLAAFQTWLHRFTGQLDIAVGTPIANRTRTEIEPLIGFFLNTLVLRIDLADNPTFRDLLSRVRTVLLEAYAHRDLPFEKLVEEMQVGRDLNRNPLFQIMFVVQNEPLTSPELPGLNVEVANVESETAKFDLTVTFTDAGSVIKVWTEYRTDLFEATTIERFMSHLQTLLTGIVANPNQHLSNLPLLPEAERHQLLVEWNATRSLYPAERCLHEWFELQVARTPDTVAVIGEDQFCTYGELNARATELARYLRYIGVGPEVSVGICLRRAPEMIVGLLAVLKAGGAYVPLDPNYPQERLAFMLQDSAASVLLTQTDLRERMPHSRAQVVCLDTLKFDLDPDILPNSERFATSANLAYIIYTSGSTGKPKGVAIAHQSATALLAWAQNHYPTEVLAGTLAATSICFDLSIFEIFLPLSCGGTIILAETALHLSTLRAAPAVTLINTVPSAMQELLRLKVVPDSVRIVNLAGEPLVTGLVQKIEEQCSVEKIYDLYGPSEDTTYSTFARRSSAERATVGRPISNTRVYLLDAAMQPVPRGVPGEVCLGGAGLARGYLRRPELTAQRFVPDPFSTEPGARLYRTGDLARYLPDGNLELLGRIDHQVKVRGFRIELGEIETVLRQHPAVTDAVLVVHTDQAGDKRLIAYLAVKQLLTTPELRRHVQAQLPEYMTPAGFVLVDALPLTPNGKIDRRALPAWQPDLQGAMETSAAPQTPLQELVADQWAQVLGVERIGLHDNFFELGGHSLLATQIVARLRQQLGYDLTVRAIFEKPTVASLVEWLEAQQQMPTAQSPHIERVGCQQPLPLSFSQQQLWLIEQLAPGNPAYHIPIVVRLTGSLTQTALQHSLNDIVRRHDTLRTTFILKDGLPIQTIRPDLDLAIATFDLQAWPPDKREAEAMRSIVEHVRQPFDLTHGPMIRAALFVLDEAHYFLSVTIHHIVFDGWSTGIFLQELETLYRARLANRSGQLPELALQYADYAIWQRDWLQGDTLAHELAYWQQQLSGAPPLIDLPTDRPRPPIQRFHGAHDTIDLPPSLRESLKALSRRAGVTLFMTLLAAFTALLHRYTEQTDMVIGTPIANRNYPEIEGLIGYFVNVLMLRLKPARHQPFRDLLKHVREVTLDAQRHQALPFPTLVEALHPERNMSYNPIFQVMFSTSPQLPAPRLPGLDVAFVDIETQTYQSADLHLDLEETDRGLRGAIEYNTDLFDPGTITRLLADYQTLLEYLVADESAIDQTLSELLPTLLVIGSPSEAALPQPAAPDNLAQRKADLAKRRSSLSDTKRTLLEKRLGSK